MFVVLLYRGDGVVVCTVNRVNFGKFWSFIFQWNMFYWRGITCFQFSEIYAIQKYKSLSQIMKKYLVLMCFVGLFACDVQEARKEYTGKREFRTTDPSRLYFKNMRSAYYFRSRRPNSKKDIYVLKKNSKDSDRPVVYPLIINDWMNDMAFIFIEKNKYKYFPEGNLNILWQDADSTGNFVWKSPTKEAQFEFAKAIYQGLLKGYDMSMVSEKGDTIPFLEVHQDRRNFVVAMGDFYKLVE